MHARAGNDSVDWAIRRLAEEQHGVVGRAQLLEQGVGRGAIAHRVKQGRLCEVYRGVYVLGTRRLTPHGRWKAAVLACGEGAVLSYRAAGALWGIRGGAWLEVTVPTGRTAPRGIRLHRAVLPADEVTTRDGIPVTTVPRTLFDLAAVLQRDEWRGAFRQAEQRGLTDPLHLGDLAARYPRRPGTPIIRAVAHEAQHALALVRSELEERFQAFLINGGLPLPKTNVRIEGLEVDCAWPEQRLIVELDGRAVHGATEAFEADRARDRRLAAAGWRVVRVTWRQLHDATDELEADLRRLLGLSPRRAPRSRRSRASSTRG
jgi:very-short-patch-repair endonuclease